MRGPEKELWEDLDVLLREGGPRSPRWIVVRVVHHGASADPAAPKAVTEDEIQLALLVRGPSVEAPSREEARLRFAVSCGRALWSADERTHFMNDPGRDIEGRCRRYTLAREDAPSSAV